MVTCMPLSYLLLSTSKRCHNFGGHKLCVSFEIAVALDMDNFLDLKFIKGVYAAHNIGAIFIT